MTTPIPLPPSAPAILRLVDGRRRVGEIGAEMTVRGVAFARAWPDLFRRLEAANLLLLSPPA